MKDWGTASGSGYSLKSQSFPSSEMREEEEEEEEVEDAADCSERKELKGVWEGKRQRDVTDWVCQSRRERTDDKEARVGFVDFDVDIMEEEEVKKKLKDWI